MKAKSLPAPATPLGEDWRQHFEPADLEDNVSDEEYLERWELVRLILDASGDHDTSREAVLKWRMDDGRKLDHVITLEELVAGSWKVEDKA